MSISKDNKVEASRKEEKKKPRNCIFSDIWSGKKGKEQDSRQQTTTMGRLKQIVLIMLLVIEMMVGLNVGDLT